MTDHRLGVVLVMLLTLGCAPNPEAASLPVPWNSRFTRAVLPQPSADPLPDCGLGPVPLGQTVATFYNVLPIQVDVPVAFVEIITYPRRDPWPDWGGGGAQGWEWLPGIGLWSGTKTWVAPTPTPAVAEAALDRSVMQVIPGYGSYIPVFPDSTWTISAVRECRTATDRQPVLVLQFELERKAGGKRVYGISALWRGVYTRGTMLGLSTRAEAPAEFLTIIQRSK